MQEGKELGVPGLEEDLSSVAISAQRFPSKPEILWEGIKSGRTCCFIDLFNKAKLTRAVEALRLGLAEGEAAVEGRLSVALVNDEVDITISSPLRNSTVTEIACYK